MYAVIIRMRAASTRCATVAAICTGTLWQDKTLVDLERDHLHRETVHELGSASGTERLTERRSYDLQSRLSGFTLEQGGKRLRERRVARYHGRRQRRLRGAGGLTARRPLQSRENVRAILPAARHPRPAAQQQFAVALVEGDHALDPR